MEKKPLGESVRSFHMRELFPTALLNRESEEMIHDEGLLARFWGAWFDACKACWDTMVADAVNENPFIARTRPICDGGERPEGE